MHCNGCSVFSCIVWLLAQFLCYQINEDAHRFPPDTLSRVTARATRLSFIKWRKTRTIELFPFKFWVLIAVYWRDSPSLQEAIGRSVIVHTLQKVLDNHARDSRLEIFKKAEQNRKHTNDSAPNLMIKTSKEKKVKINRPLVFSWMCMIFVINGWRPSMRYESIVYGVDDKA